MSRLLRISLKKQNKQLHKGRLLMSLPFPCQSRFGQEMQKLGNETHGLTLQQVQTETCVVAEGTSAGHSAPTARALFKLRPILNSACSTPPQGFCGGAVAHTCPLQLPCAVLCLSSSWPPFLAISNPDASFSRSILQLR